MSFPGVYPLAAYEKPSTHEAISQLIQRHSRNPLEIREAMLKDLDLSGTAEVLDLGCGFGFMAEGLARKSAQSMNILGIDACGENRQIFKDKVEAYGHRCRFLHTHLDSDLYFKEESYDLVLSSYSLYFFPLMIPEVARVLRRHGTFLVVTHAEKTFRELCRKLGVGEGSPLLSLVNEFSSENGKAMLSTHFEEVRRVDYENELVFDSSEFEDLKRYLEFKLPLLVSGAVSETSVLKALLKKAKAYMEAHGSLRFSKNDTAFICRRPQCL